MVLMMARPVTGRSRRVWQAGVIRRARERERLADRIERYCAPQCEGCGDRRVSVLAVVSAAGNVWHLCPGCADRARVG